MPEPGMLESLAETIKMLTQVTSDSTVRGNQDIMTEFFAAVRDGRLNEFLAANPDLNGDDLMVLFRALDSEGALGEDLRDETRPGIKAIKAGVDPGWKEEAQEQLAARGLEDRIMIAPGDTTMMEFAQNYIKKQAEGGQEIPPEAINMLATLLTQYNPESKDLAALPKGFPMDVSFLTTKYTWQKGDTIETVAAKFKVSPAAVMNAIAQAGLSPDALSAGMEIPIPGRELAAAGATATPTGGRGEQTMPESQDPANNPAAPTDPNAPGGPLPGDPNNLMESNLSDAAFMQMLTEGLSPSERGMWSDQTANISQFANLLASAGLIDPIVSDVTREGAWRQAMGTPVDELQQAFYSMFQPGAVGTPAGEFTDDSSRQFNTAMAILITALGGPMASGLLNNGGQEVSAAAERMAAEKGITVAQAMHELGWV